MTKLETHLVKFQFGHLRRILQTLVLPIWSNLTKLGPNLVSRSPNMVNIDQIGVSTFPIWSRLFYCSNLVKINVALIWSTIFPNLVTFPMGPIWSNPGIFPNLVTFPKGPIWSNPGAFQFGHPLYIHPQYYSNLVNRHQFGQILVHSNLVTLCTYILSTTPIWSTDTPCLPNGPIWSTDTPCLQLVLLPNLVNRQIVNEVVH